MNSILAERYVSPEMAHIFSDISRYGKWRLVWLTLAEAQLEAGFPIDPIKLEECRKTADQINFDRVKEIEAETRHDVMAHLKYWAEICPAVNHTIHLGATSCYVTDNAECLLNKEALAFTVKQLRELNTLLARLASKTANHAVLGYTHFQPASPTTIGKRVATWLQDLIGDYDELVSYHNTMRCRGAKGTTGTQASFLELARGNKAKVKRMDVLVAKKLLFPGSVKLSGQTISRKQEVRLADLLSSLAISLSKIGNDMRLLSHTGDLYEGFGRGQVGSSAMPWKRNPMLSERLCSLTRMIPQYREMLTQTAMTQWLERTLDDSAIRRVAIPDIFLATNSALNTAIKLIKSIDPVDLTLDEANITVYASELLLARAVLRGYSRQEAHACLQAFVSEASKAACFNTRFRELVVGHEMWAEDDLAKNLRNLRMRDLIGLAADQTMEFLSQHKNYFDAYAP